MQTNLETLSTLERRINMAVPADEINKEIAERLKKLSRTTRMAGFRPGKVPYKLIEQQYGPQVRSEVLGNAVQKAFTEVVSAQKLRVAGYPRIEPKTEGADGATIAFSATFEVYPEFKLGDVASTKISRSQLKVSDADVDNTIEVLRKQRATWHVVTRAAQAGDQLKVDFSGKIDGVEFAGGKGTDVPVVLGEGRMLPDFEKGLAGATTGEARTFDVTFPENYGAKEVSGKKATFDATVKSVEEPRLPALDAEFAKSLGVADGDIEKMRADVRANVEREVAKRLADDEKSKVMQALIDTTQIEVPKSLIGMEVERMVESARADLAARGMKLEKMPFDPAMFEAQAKRRVTLGLIVGELIKEHKLEAKPEQVRALVDAFAQTYEHPTEVVKWVYSEAQRLADFEGQATEANVVAWVLGRATVEDKPIGFNELMGKTA